MSARCSVSGFLLETTVPVFSQKPTRRSPQLKPPGCVQRSGIRSWVKGTTVACSGPGSGTLGRKLRRCSLVGGRECNPSPGFGGFIGDCLKTKVSRLQPWLVVPGAVSNVRSLSVSPLIKGSPELTKETMGLRGHMGLSFKDPRSNVRCRERDTNHHVTDSSEMKRLLKYTYRI